MKFLRGIAYVLVALFFAVVLLALYDSSRPAAYRRRAAAVHVGDTKAQVTAALGKPTARVSTPTPNIFVPVPEQWMYGSTCDWHYWRRPFSSDFLSLIKIFPRDDDVVVDFDKSGIVLDVVIPEK
jgi:hypothetical protein